MTLLQKLLVDRAEVIVLSHKFAYCSCGDKFEDYSDAENHLVQYHEKRSHNEKKNGSGSNKNNLADILSSLAETLRENADESKSAGDSSWSIQLPEKTMAVLLGEDEINGGQLQDVHCPECGDQFTSFDRLKVHYLKIHPEKWPRKEDNTDNNLLFERPKVRSKLPNWNYHYFCPLPGCKYNILENSKQDPEKQRYILDGTSSNYFTQYANLKQHYSKTHATKLFKCTSCDQGFSTEMFLTRHKKVACGKSFICASCGRKFAAFENLQTHCRRKKHDIPLNLKVHLRKKSPISKTTDLFTPLTTVSKLGQITKGKYLKIAPMPSLHHMTAAIALSELSTVAGSDKKTKSELQKNLVSTLSGPDIVTSWSQLPQESTKLCQSHAGVQTMVLVTSPPEKPLVASTQTSTNQDASTSDLVSPGEEKKHAPKLGDIEQFSTETQTDEMIVVDDPFTIEAQTQFDLDDILCSNYTQTALFTSTLDTQSNNVATAASTSAETQTMFSLDEVAAASGIHMETQTPHDSFSIFDDEDGPS